MYYQQCQVQCQQVGVELIEDVLDGYCDGGVVCIGCLGNYQWYIDGGLFGYQYFYDKQVENGGVFGQFLQQVIVYIVDDIDFFMEVQLQVVLFYCQLYCIENKEK